jgi:hypothetical protein
MRCVAMPLILAMCNLVGAAASELYARADSCDCGINSEIEFMLEINDPTLYGMPPSPDGFRCKCPQKNDQQGCCDLGHSCSDYCLDYTMNRITNRKKLKDGRVLFKAKLKDSRWDCRGPRKVISCPG